jgi:hypothetical protein
VQLIDRNTDTTYIVVGSEPFSPRMTRPSGAATSQRLCVILGAAVLVIAGPSVLDTLAQATLASAQLLLEIGRMGLVAYEMFGK